MDSDLHEFREVKNKLEDRLKEANVNIEQLKQNEKVNFQILDMNDQFKYKNNFSPISG